MKPIEISIGIDAYLATSIRVMKLYLYTISV